MTTAETDISRWIVQRVEAGDSPDVLLDNMVSHGWSRDLASSTLKDTLQRHIEQVSREQGLPLPVKVPNPVEWNGAGVIQLPDREVQILANMLLPRVVVLGNLLSHEECDALIGMARARLAPSMTLNLETGTDEPNAARTSRGTYFYRGRDPLCDRIDARLSALLDWPVEHGEGLQVLHYGPGAEYKPHYDYFDPSRPGAGDTLKRGGQRVASVVMYLNTPEAGGSTSFPDVHFEVAAIKGNAVFFSYDRAHPMTKSLHGGSPVKAGEKWVATKWLRESVHV